MTEDVATQLAHFSFAVPGVELRDFNYSRLYLQLSPVAVCEVAPIALLSEVNAGTVVALVLPSRALAANTRMDGQPFLAVEPSSVTLSGGGLAPTPLQCPLALADSVTADVLHPLDGVDFTGIQVFTRFEELGDRWPSSESLSAVSDCSSVYA